MTAQPSIPDIIAAPAWDALRKNHDQIGETHLRQLFADDPDRGRDLTITVGDLYIDYSKHRVTRETLRLLIELARAAGLEERRDQMFSGVHINTSEDRAVLHTALRLPATPSSLSAAAMWCRTCMPCWMRWATSPTGCAAASGPEPPESGSPPWSTSASAVRTSAR
ncbi:phosphoglucose isomerase family protein [Mycobacterium kansasii]|uniref:Phosphoglucose isomerase family protein n=1 Tax=Mycobacterium kansasii TaxID=1768 RepID=A0A1V3XM06_MYCKA|nr:phosphoglucose isomerase family protein [Mycobacterium kansasii]